MRIAGVVAACYLASAPGFAREPGVAAPDAKSSAPTLIDFIDLHRLDPQLPALPTGFYRTQSFAFSPDEKWIVVVVSTRANNPRGPGRALDSMLLLAPVHPSDGRWVRISPGMPSGAPYWSPDSDSVAVQAIPATRNAGTSAIKMYDLRGELLWMGSGSGRIMGFIEPGRLLSQHLTGKAGLDTIDVQTSAVTPWPASRHWRIGAISPDRDLMAVFPDADGTKTLIVEHKTGKILQSMQNRLWLHNLGALTGAPAVYFAEHGKAVCFVPNYGSEISGFSTSPVCRDVDTGRTIAELRTVEGGVPADASSGNTRMIVTRVNYFPTRAGIETYGGTVVWDFRAGAEIAAWKPQDLQLPLLWQRPLSGTVPTVVMSSSGKYIALGFDGAVGIYELP